MRGTQLAVVDDLKRAEEARNQRRYADASQIYLEVLDKLGPDPDVMWGLAQTEFALSVVSPQPDDAHGHAAIEWIEQALAIKPNKPEYYAELGQMLEQVGAPDYRAAAEAYRHAIELEPNYVPALDNLAGLYGVPEDVVPLEEALPCSERVTRIFPTRSRWLQLSRLLKEAGRLDEAHTALKNSLLQMYDTTAQVY